MVLSCVLFSEPVQHKKRKGRSGNPCKNTGNCPMVKNKPKSYLICLQLVPSEITSIEVLLATEVTDAVVISM